MVTDRLTGRLGTEPILSIKRFVSIDTMINFDGDGDGDGTCKQYEDVRNKRSEKWSKRRAKIW